ncbi:Pachytene checkpoint protein 2 like protein [Dictyocoela muelleri]|nr:Pachytene checkpoint protein 2 like protein [Dictyocoela muelleri]
MIKIIFECEKKSEQHLKKLISQKATLNTKISEEIQICEAYENENLLEKEEFTKYIPKIYFYTISSSVEQTETCIKYSLPNTRLSSLWASIESSQKYFLLNQLMHIFKMQKKINLKIFSIGNTVLLYGPPGTGKTTLAKAIAQKISIRKYPLTFLHVKASSLVSKFYRESSKFIDSLFKEIRETSPAFILIDEIESLLSTRTIYNNSEPLDSMRIVNTFLVNLEDQNEKCIFFFTTNLIEKIDPAFLDRIDIKLEIKKPESKNVFNFLKNMINYLITIELIDYTTISDYETAEKLGQYIDDQSYRLFMISKKLEKESFRTIKKIIFFSLTSDPQKIGDFFDKFETKLENEEDD